MNNTFMHIFDFTYVHTHKHTHTFSLSLSRFLAQGSKPPTCMAFNELVMLHWPHNPCKSPHCFIKVLDLLGIPPFHYYRESKTQPFHREYKIPKFTVFLLQEFLQPHMTNLPMTGSKQES